MKRLPEVLLFLAASCFVVAALLSFMVQKKLKARIDHYRNHWSEVCCVCEDADG